MDIGNTLKAARESRGISLETAEEKTKIRRKYLEALEEDNFDVLPGRVYIKGFIKNYALFLDLSANALVKAYEESRPQCEEEQAEKKPAPIEKQGGKGFSRLALGIAAVVVVAGIVYLSGIKDNKAAIPPGNGNNGVAAGNNDARSKVPAVPQNKPEILRGVNVVLNVTDNPSWMHVEVDGKPAFTGTVPAGQIKEFKGNDKITLRIGNAGVVQVEFNGNKMGVLGAPGQVVTKEFNAPQG